MIPSTDRILTTHTGSLPRPAALMQLLVARERGEPNDRQAFDRVVADAVRDVVRRQAECGVDIVSDGEMSKPDYATYIQQRLSGFGGEYSTRPPRDMAAFGGLYEKMQAGGFAAKGVVPRRYCIGPVAVVDTSQLERDLANFMAAVAEANVAGAFMNAASPGVVTSFQLNNFYPSHDAYLAAISDAMRVEYEAIVGAGFLLQLDCPDLAMSRHTTFQDIDESEFIKLAEAHVEAMNAALSNIPAEKVRMHICWGNYEGPHDCDIDVARILPILKKAKPQAYVFEAANPRHQHEWAAWRDAKLPDDKVLVPGVVDSSTNYVEHPELIAQRLETYAGIVGRERVMAGSDCGFGTFAGFAKVDPEIAYKKLAAMAEGARIASARLWGKGQAAE